MDFQPYSGMFCFQTVKYGVHAVFETTVRGSPNPEVTWFINGVKMDKDTPGVKIEVS